MAFILINIYWFLIVQAQDVNILQAIRNYAKAHPVRTGIQVVGLALSAVSFLAVPVLGAVGFTAAGPVAGSAAAAWQASIGAVEAGSLFAWCQSAAMGGAAMGGIQVAGIAGAAITKVVDVPGLVETFKSVCRTAKKWLGCSWKSLEDLETGDLSMKAISQPGRSQYSC